MTSILFVGLFSTAITAVEPAPSRSELITTAIERLVAMQEADGQWAYEGVYRVGGEIPIGYRVGGTAIVAGVLQRAAADRPEVKSAVAKALAYVLQGLDHPLMTPSTKDAYDVRVWGHAYALEFLCQMRAATATGDHAAAVAEWIPKLVATLITEELPGGGWNYANRQRPASFVTAPVVQALLVAREQGEKVPDEVFARAKASLEKGRTNEGGFVYSGNNQRVRGGDQPPGSAARSTVCETTLMLLGGGSIDAVRGSVENFHTNWDELKKRHQKTGTHVGPYSIAPYYFFYGHRYVAQAIQMLPETERSKQRERLLATILKTREADGTWNDRVFPRSRGYGTAMIVLALLDDTPPIPGRWPGK